MKNSLIKCFTILGLVLSASSVNAQYVSNDNEAGVYLLSKNAPQYVEGEVIVKFTDSEKLSIKRNAQGRFLSASASAVNAQLQELGTYAMEQLMPLSGAKRDLGARRAVSSNRMISDVDLSQLYVVKYSKEDISVFDVIERLKTLDNVEFAEPNSIAYICGTEADETTYTDPLYSQQWGIPAINLPALWSLPKTDQRRPIIAILDTGVEITHPDLVDNIWTNQAELTGSEFVDDDNNGYYDDLHGWDFVSNTAIINDGMDKNGHGTHCAGIAAACGNNGVGIVGANPDAIILPIKVIGDDGFGTETSVIRGIDYAIAAKADLLSMSFGTYAPTSHALRTVLEKAYTKNIISVGAAGNSNRSINCNSPLVPSPIAPGCFDIVVGVMASESNGLKADYSNFDPDGPFFSRYGEIYGDYYNYDVLAPGSNILSTYPGGRYKFLSGTSMATPLLAGSLSRLLQVRGYDYAKDYGIYGDIAESKNQDGIFDIYMATTWTEENRKVALRLQSTTIVEVEGDMDGEIDAGEIIDIYPTIRSLWGHAENIKISARSDYNPNISANAVTFLSNNVDFGHVLNSQGSATSVNPIRFKVNEKVNDGYNLILYYTISCDNETDEETNTEKELTYKVENGVELKGIISHDMTLYPDVHYIIRGTVGIAPGVTLTIKGGTVIKCSGSPNIRCEGTLVCESSPDSMIVVTKADYEAGPLQMRIDNGSFEYTKFKDVFERSLLRASFYHCQFDHIWWVDNAEYCTFYDPFVVALRRMYGESYRYCNLIGHAYLVDERDALASPRCSNLLGGSFELYSEEICECLITNYLGSSSNSLIEQYVIDANDYYMYGFFDPEHVRKIPYAEAHGCVWKILVDDFDVQDGYEAMDNAPENYPTSPTNQNYELFPIGVGTHECKVYFNRPMDVSVNPTVTMGLRSPYTQTEMNPDGVWSADSLVYTTTFAISAKSNIDGVNRILVDDAEDNEHFKIPQESKRFNVLVQVSGSLSTGLVATAGLGNVQLDWETKDEDFADLMGYNVYRYTVDEQGMSSDTIMMNDQLIEPGEIDEAGTMTQSFTDYDVVPGITYYYIVKEIGTDLQSYDVSNPVAATPLTASLGDANGSMTVDIADVMTEIYYLTGENPKPFIFEAADVNCDQTVNILDVIGTINLITESAKTESISDNEIAHYYIDNGKLYVETPIALSGLQVQVKGNRSSSAISLSDELKGFETVNNWLSDSKYLLLCYSLSGMVFSPGKHFLLELGNETEISELILSDTAGHNVIAINDSAASIENLDQDLPFSSHGQIEYRIVDMYGRMVAKDAIQRGIYVVNVYVDGQVIKSYKLLQK